ncbi:MAG: 2-oxo acid dehydrogenase subunit E2 [Bacteroidetes bacterium]|nr:MAG: 2-oxo acid dehydrogenase subunit E2 [Bacteroidota bacterium]REK00070.1 MAG: 2-oxo acid dehydrogenase subunit E2 [Bacteroidota bacterium]REK35926.1 MAG: 2-oxo acid dehydrogenase subunit E2 [Bacteroidota bacterium]REK50700.1 MAG: 2-oxo acid dehydrogenase subunit E2 [Bacteroidota bacterium]
MGESVAEATILKWLKKEGDVIEADEAVLEIATDKVDSEVPSPAGGILHKRLFEEGQVVKVGEVIAHIQAEGEEKPKTAAPAASQTKVSESGNGSVSKSVPVPTSAASVKTSVEDVPRLSASGRFYSPLVRSIAKEEGISVEELDSINGSGLNNRLTKQDLLKHLESGQKGIQKQVSPASEPAKASAPSYTPPSISVSGGTEIIEMDRMRKLISDHMVMSKHTSPHVTSFVEADVTNLVKWRDKVKKEFEKKENEKITFTPLFIEAVCRAIKDFPMVNVSTDGNKIYKKNFINIGMATALPSGNLIVPVIKNADHLNLIGLTKAVNDLANRARQNKLKPDEIQDGTFTLTNVGTFGNVMGTPIINQPQVAILAAGAIRKKPAVVETPEGDAIAIRHMMFLSLSYDHRVVDGALGGSFLRRIADYLENFDMNRSF